MPDGPTETLRSTSNFRRLNEPGTGLDPSAHEDTARRRHRWDRLFVVIHYQPAADLDFDSRQSTGAGDCGHEPFEDDLLLFEPAAVRGHCLPVVHRRGARPFSTYVMESCAFLARNFSRCASRSIFMGLWRHFARGSNFWNLALFGSGYAGLGELEDRFFATVFLGSGLLFIAMVFSAAAAAGGILTVLGSGPENLVQSGAYALGRAEIAQMMHIYAMKMAGVFMITTSTISIQTRVFPHWMAVVGYGLALMLLLSVGTIDWIPLVFPLWVLLISAYILVENLRGQSESPT